MVVITVENTLLILPALNNTSEFTLVRNHMDVTSVENASLTRPTLTNTREFTLEKHHTNVSSVGASLRGVMN